MTPLLRLRAGARLVVSRGAGLWNATWAESLRSRSGADAAAAGRWPGRRTGRRPARAARWVQGRAGSRYREERWSASTCEPDASCAGIPEADLDGGTGLASSPGCARCTAGGRSFSETVGRQRRRAHRRNLRRRTTAVVGHGRLHLVHPSRTKENLLVRFHLIGAIAHQFRNNHRSRISRQGADAGVSPSIGADGVVELRPGPRAACGSPA